MVTQTPLLRLHVNYENTVLDYVSYISVCLMRIRQWERIHKLLDTTLCHSYVYRAAVFLGLNTGALMGPFLVSSSGPD